MPSKRLLRIAKLIIILLLGTTSVFAEDDDARIFHLPLEELLELKVSTGQRSSQTVYRELPVPVRIITRAELEKSGYTELGKVLPNSIFGQGLLLPYHQLSPFGLNGAFYYMTLTYGF